MVELVDEHGAVTGEMQVGAAHTAPGTLHRAFSVVVVDDAGRMLLQQRADAKLRFPGLWTNSCCGHPAPGADLAASAARRVHEELGADLVDAHAVGTFRYRALDAGSGHVETEFDHVVVGRLSGEPRPDPDEVGATRWVSAEEARALVDAGVTTPWFVDVLRIVAPHDADAR
ncbi:isopentenyl-diphosphate Delta-isomerase [Cellulomonas shaoxiangyii]|uniref:Isopentenyl-diphosphate delta-isomerase n=1 Tax=Cellulomonas shaoxiangyii TaxID=2566013 RepID=A0A4P7SMT9_9CELL|nr:isopentenyl-diphosphate Delta-isomerase [Cellulomonas shaoxiangyii]TGY81511.1 isopentenyl-diphosphate Delta-isomerase [Cellulomonas shaoxiangyii]